MRKNLHYLNQERLNIIFNHVYDSMYIKRDKRVFDDEKLNDLFNALKAAQYFNHRHRIGDICHLFRLLSPIYNFESNSEGATIFLSLILAIQEMYNFSDKKLLEVINQIDTLRESRVDRILFLTNLGPIKNIW